MACSIDLPFWPVATDCVNWSRDNLIAVVGGELVAVLVPRLGQPGPDGSNWDTVLLTVNVFARSEVPARPLLSKESFSIGEEIAQWAAIRATWSSPGLTKQRSCALAVLTSNHVLSIWAPDGDTAESVNWSRRLVFSPMIEQYYDRQLPSQHEGSFERAERLQVSQRVLAFAWSDALRLTRADEIKEAKAFVDWGTHFIAVATGCGDILIFRVQPRHDKQASEWGVFLTDTINIGDHLHDALSQSERLAVHSNARAGQHGVTHALTWTGWSWDESVGDYANLSCIVDGMLLKIRVYGATDEHSAVVVSYRKPLVHRLLPEHANLSPGPLVVGSTSTSQYLFAATLDAVFQIALDDHSDVHTHDLDGQWDAVSGLASSRHAVDRYTLHVVSLLSSAKARAAQLKLPLQSGSGEMPSWQYVLDECKSLFSTEFDLDGNVADRTYGIASSPFANYVAFCSSFHPSDSIEYSIGSEHTCLLNISLEVTPPHDEPLYIPRINGTPVPVPIETVVFELKQRMENDLHFSTGQRFDRASLTSQVSNMLPHYAPENQTMATQKGTTDYGKLERNLRLRIYLDMELQQHRASLIADCILGGSISHNELDRLLIRKLVAVGLSIPIHAMHMDDQSQRTRHIYEAIRSPPEANPAQKRSKSSTPKSQEVCPICAQPVPFQSVLWAVCSSGHEFPRCALTFLLVPEAALMKKCGICSAAVFNERLLSEVAAPRSPAARPEKEPQIVKPTFIDILFATYDCCVYCGGRFLE